MKRILICGIVTAVSMFFTGCNSMLTSMTGGGYENIKWDVMETQPERRNWGEAGLMDGETMPETTAPDYYEMNEDEKFADLEGKRAFRLKPEHSEEVEDIASFQIGTLLEDGSFVYAYATLEKGTGNVVHCVAKYQYETGIFTVLHEKVFSRSSVAEEEESFYIQMCEDSGGSQQVFVYDNGVGTLYSLDGSKVFETDIESFVRSHFTKGYSVSTTNAMTDGNKRVYIELIVEKENIAFEEVENPEEGDDTSEEDADAEAEALEGEMGEKTIEMVLVYDFKNINTSIDQCNSAFWDQVETWKDMADGETFTSHPDAEADWTSTVASVPDVWETVFLDSVNLTSADEDYLEEIGMSDYDTHGVPVFEWKGSKTFETSHDGYVCEFQVPKLNKNHYAGFTDLEAGKTLDQDLFILQGDRYYELFGTTGEWKYYDHNTFSRTYTYKWTTTTTKDGETTTEEHSQTYTQSLNKPRWRYTSMINDYLEGYWTLTDIGITGIFGVADHMVLCSSKDKAYWLKRDGSTLELGISLEEEESWEDYLIDTFEEGGKLYVVLTSDSGVFIVNQDLNDGESVTNEGIWMILPGMLQVETENPDLKGREMTANDEKYVDAHEKLEEDTMGDLANIVPSGHFDATHIRRVNLTPDDSLMNRLEDLGVDLSDKQARGDGFLVTTLDSGLVFVNPSSFKSVCLEHGTWYGTWSHGDKLLSVGFATDSSYGTLDVVHARVQEYTVDELHRKMLQDMIDVAEEEIRQRELEELARESAAAESSQETEETTKSSLDEWTEDKAAKDETAGELDLGNLRDGMNEEREKIEDLTPEERRERQKAE